MKLQTEFKPGRGYTKEDWDEVSDNPELTKEEIAQMRPFAEVFPELAKTIKKTRGPQKLRTKTLMSMRFDTKMLERFKETGPGWQARMNDVLVKASKKLKK